MQCDDYMPLANATDSIFNPVQSGSYAVELTVNNCKDTSGCYEVNIADIIFNTLGAGLKLYPNPTSGQIHIDLPDRYDMISVELTNPGGQSMLIENFSKTQTIGLSLHASPGQYYLIIRNNRNDKAVVKITLTN
jgi:hypothetical protein